MAAMPSSRCRSTLGAIDCGPALSANKSRAAERGHGGRAIKLWLQLAGAEVGTLVTGGTRGPNWLFVERRSAAGTVFAVAFAVDDGRFDPSSRTEVEGALARLLPDARLVAYDWTDWISGPHCL
jgi:hypothetical protein